MCSYIKPDFEELTDTKKEISFQITDWFVPESDKIQIDYSEEQREYVINIYGKDKDGISICTKVIGFMPFFYLKPPESWEEFDDKTFKSKVGQLKLKLMDESYETKFKTKKRIISKCYENHLKEVTFEYKKDFWGFTNNKDFRYIKITVKSLALFNNLKYYFQDNKEGFKLCESNID
jgi:hypothetical protein